MLKIFQKIFGIVILAYLPTPFSSNFLQFYKFTCKVGFFLKFFNNLLHQRFRREDENAYVKADKKNVKARLMEEFERLKGLLGLDSGLKVVWMPYGGRGLSGVERLHTQSASSPNQASELSQRISFPIKNNKGKSCI
ncbi:MAG: hypothetical protein ACKD6O_06330 [Candidatus Bathyarchaeota archaeon]